MKTLRVLSLCLFLSFLTISNTASIAEENFSGTSITQSMQTLWSQMFKISRGASCMKDRIRNQVLNRIKQSVEASLNPNKAKKGKFWWVKEWGYGKGAYIFDYMDPVLRDVVLKEFHRIFDDTMAISPKGDTSYSDPFDLKNFISKDTSPKMRKKFEQNLKKINENYDPSIFKKSVNAVQIHNAMKKFKWYIDEGLKDYASSFIKRYDMNGDGRLNPREFILGALDHNKHLFGAFQCNHCFNSAVTIIDSLFVYMDCDNDGLVSAEDMWDKLPNLNRPSGSYNIFALAEDAPIRTASVNDFVLKNMKARNGMLTKVEFRNGILFGIWDRQTDFKHIIDDGSRTLRKFRWKDDRMVDVVAERYIRDKLTAEAKRKQPQH